MIRQHAKSGRPLGRPESRSSFLGDFEAPFSLEAPADERQ